MSRPGGLVVENLAVERGGRPILAGVSFRVSEGTALTITGPNGAGKSTLLRALAGLIPKTAGLVSLFIARGADATIEGNTHYLGHADGLKRALTARDNLEFTAGWAGAGGLSPDAALARLGIGHVADLPVNFLSAGQRRRVALARLLVAHRPLWLVDEPTTALDARAEVILGEAMRAHLDAGGLVVAATHTPLPIPAGALRLGPP